MKQPEVTVVAFAHDPIACAVAEQLANQGGSELAEQRQTRKFVSVSCLSKGVKKEWQGVLRFPIRTAKTKTTQGRVVSRFDCLNVRLAITEPDSPLTRDASWQIVSDLRQLRGRFTTSPMRTANPRQFDPSYGVICASRRMVILSELTFDQVRAAADQLAADLILSRAVL